MEKMPQTQAEPTPARKKELIAAYQNGDITPSDSQARSVGGGMKRAEERAQATMDLNAQMKGHEDAAETHYQAIEDRITKGDVQALNDQAMFEIYGSEIPVVRKTEKDKPTRRNLEDGAEVFEDGSTGVQDTAPKKHKDVKGTVGYTVVDPESGEVIGSPEKPLKGKLGEMRDNPKYGKTQAERDKAANKYEKDLLKLVEDDELELVQAKLIMDMREKDQEGIINLAGKLELGGMSRTEARKKAEERYAHLDEIRVDTIKHEGVFTQDEYKRVKFGNGDYLYEEGDGGNGPKDDKGPDGDKPEPSSPSDGGLEGLSRSQQALVVARDAFNPKPVPEGASDEERSKIEGENRDKISLLQRFGYALDNYTRLQGIVDSAQARGKLTPEDKKALVLDTHTSDDPKTIELDKDDKTALQQAGMQLDKLRQKYEGIRSQVDGHIMQALVNHGFDEDEISREMLAQAAGTTHDVLIDSQTGKPKPRSGEAGLIADLTVQEVKNRAGTESDSRTAEILEGSKPEKVAKWFGRSALRRTVARPFSRNARKAARLIKEDGNESAKAPGAQKRSQANLAEQRARLADEYDAMLANRDHSEHGGQKRKNYIYDPKDVSSAHFAGATRNIDKKYRKSIADRKPLDMLTDAARAENDSSGEAPTEVRPPRSEGTSDADSETGGEKGPVFLTREHAVIGHAYNELVKRGNPNPTQEEVAAEAIKFLETHRAVEESDDDKDGGETKVMPSDGKS